MSIQLTNEMIVRLVITGRVVPAIHVFWTDTLQKTWMPGTHLLTFESFLADVRLLNLRR